MKITRFLKADIDMKILYGLTIVDTTDGGINSPGE